MSIVRRKFARPVLLVALFLLGSHLGSDAFALPGIALGPNSIVKIKSTTCGFVKNKWVPGARLKTGNFLPTSQKISALNKQLKRKKTKPALKAKISKTIDSLKKSLKAKAKICKGLTSSVPNPNPTTGPTPTVTPASPLPGATSVAWSVDVRDQASNLGGEYLFFCPPNPSEALRSIYGHDIYTTDSPICVAAVHLGLFSRASGGNAKLRIKPGQTNYLGSNRNGIQSNFFTAFTSSYVFLDINSGVELITNTVPQITWAQTAQPVYTLVEGQFQFFCPSGLGQTRSIWGTDLYTYDSSICTAAVHAGRISVANGGVVTIQVKPGASNYVGSTRHGITSDNYGPWGGSFIFVP